MRTTLKIVAVAVATLAPLALAGLMSGRSAAAQTPRGVTASAPQLTITVRPTAEVGTQNAAFAAVIEVGANPVFVGSGVTLSSPQLFGDCGGALSWMTDTPGTWDAPTVSQNSPTFTVNLDGDGNALASITGGPSCSAGRGKIVAQLNAPQHYVASAFFTLQAARATAARLTAMPSVEIEDASADVALVMGLEFTAANATKTVTLSSAELSGNCKAEVNWYPLVGSGSRAVDALQVTVTLDGKGNAYVLILAGPHCLTSTNEIDAQLNTPPHTALTASFTIQPPRCTVACGGAAGGRRLGGIAA